MALEAYQINKDNFYSETKYSSRKSFNFKHSARKDKNSYKDCLCQRPLKGNNFQKYYWLQLYYLPLQSSLVLLHVDVESNTGPTYAIHRTALETNNQRDRRFSHAAGIQRACNSFYSLIWSQICSFNSQKLNDLDHVLLETDKPFKSLDTSSLLAAKELPHTINLLKVEIHVKFSQPETYQISRIDDDQCLTIYGLSIASYFLRMG